MSYPTVTAAALTAPLTFAGIVEQLRDTFRAFPDCRKPGNNTRYTLEDAGLSAFSVFFMQCASFLEYQRRMVENQERSNRHYSKISHLSLVNKSCEKSMGMRYNL